MQQCFVVAKNSRSTRPAQFYSNGKAVSFINRSKGIINPYRAFLQGQKAIKQQHQKAVNNDVLMLSYSSACCYAAGAAAQYALKVDANIYIHKVIQRLTMRTAALVVFF